MSKDCRGLHVKRTPLLERRKETFRDKNNNINVAVHVTNACEMTIFGSKINTSY